MERADQTRKVTRGLSQIIQDELTALSSEYRQPRFAADQMDAELKFRKDRIIFLRNMREEFENQMNGVRPEAV